MKWMQKKSPVVSVSVFNVKHKWAFRLSCILSQKTGLVVRSPTHTHTCMRHDIQAMLWSLLPTSTLPNDIPPMSLFACLGLNPQSIYPCDVEIIDLGLDTWISLTNINVEPNPKYMCETALILEGLQYLLTLCKGKFTTFNFKLIS